MKIFIPIVFLPLTGCASLLTWAKDAAAGVVAGGSDVPDAIVEGVSALETGGWTAAVIVTALGLVKAGVKGWGVANQASKARRLGEIAEGVKKAGNDTN